MLERHGDRIGLVHLTDSIAEEEPHHRHYGMGDVPLEECATAANAGDVAWCIYEYGQPDGPERALEKAVERLLRLLETEHSPRPIGAGDQNRPEPPTENIRGPR